MHQGLMVWATTLNKLTGVNTMEKWDKLERIVFLLGLIVVALDLYYWRP